MPRTTPPRLDDQLCFAIYSANLAIAGTYKPILAELGLTYPQYVVMLCLWQEDGQNVLQIADRVHMDAGTLSPILKRLEAAGLVSKQRVPDDERRVQVSLTEQGAALGGRARQASKAFGLACALTDPVVEDLRGQLMALRDRLLALQG